MDGVQFIGFQVVENLISLGPMLPGVDCLLRAVVTTICWFCARNGPHTSQRSFCCIVEAGERGDYATSLPSVRLHSLLTALDSSNFFARWSVSLRVLPSSVATIDEPPPSLLPAPFPTATAAARAAPVPGPFSVAVPLDARAPESPPCPTPFQVPFLVDDMENLAE